MWPEDQFYHVGASSFQPDRQLGQIRYVKQMRQIDKINRQKQSKDSQADLDRVGLADRQRVLGKKIFNNIPLAKNISIFLVHFNKKWQLTVTQKIQTSLVNF